MLISDKLTGIDRTLIEEHEEVTADTVKNDDVQAVASTETGVHILWRAREDHDLPVAVIDGVTVTDTDIRSLRPGSWVTDTIMDMYAALFSKGQERLLVLPQITISSIMDGRQIKLTKKIVDLRSYTLHFLNPTGERKVEEIQVLLKFQDFLRITGEMGLLKLKRLPHSHQMDSYNCGPYCMLKRWRVSAHHVATDMKMNAPTDDDDVKRCPTSTIERIRTDDDDVKRCPTSTIECIRTDDDDVKSCPTSTIERIRTDDDDVKSCPTSTIERIRTDDDDFKSCQTSTTERIRTDDDDVKRCSTSTIECIRTDDDDVKSCPTSTIERIRTDDDDVKSCPTSTIERIRTDDDDFKSCQTSTTERIRTDDDDVKRCSTSTIECIRTDDDDVKSCPTSTIERIRIDDDDVKSCPTSTIVRIRTDDDDVKSCPTSTIERIRTDDDDNKCCLTSTIERIRTDDVKEHHVKDWEVEPLPDNFTDGNEYNDSDYLVTYKDALLKTIHLITRNLNCNMLQKESLYRYSLQNEVVALANPALKKACRADRSLAAIYAKRVLLKEALIVIMQKHIKEHSYASEDSKTRLYFEEQKVIGVFVAERLGFTSLVQPSADKPARLTRTATHTRELPYLRPRQRREAAAFRGGFIRERDVNRDAMRKAMTLFYWLVKEEIPHHTKFESFMDTIKGMGMNVLNMLTLGGNANYTSNDFVNKTVVLNIVAEIQQSPFYSVMIDETTDIATHSQLIIYVRYHHQGASKTAFCPLVKVHIRAAVV
ncbi:hypothetical protein MAR_021039 [Mya arenaria]|uniref:DUF4371 domain-containing protein n=1 Tax=Mya arenaria TaxID=6604 RepID=A0ABY7E732_MYAAR|nr:hypothetical protein MAR_021039 [Mya arenaria]